MDKVMPASPRLQFSPQRNYNLWIGAVLVLFITIVGFFGPVLAPHDPLQENFVVFVDDTTFIKPPFAAFLVPGFPLGSDEFGRDVLSRLLWGIKPTLILVLVAATLRLIIGAIIGMLSGWFPGRSTEVLNTLISMTGALPVLFVALGVIAATGQKLGIWAFILGLTLTGWGDAARLVRDQTRVIKSQLYIEASQALGSSNRQLLVTHVLPQIMPSIWMMLAFEVSGAMLITAELGVLGYFTNAVWIPIDDWVGLRTSGIPELSQMLGDLQKQPWGALGAGAIVFITILGFNLLGEGLRVWASPEFRRRQKSRLGLQISEWIDDRIFSPQESLKRTAPIYLGILLLLTIVIGGGIYLWQNQNLEALKNIAPLPGNHLWVSTYRDSQGTLWTPYISPKNPKVAWSLDFGSSLTGGPVIDSKGSLFIATADSRLHAVSPEGKKLWSASLPNPPIGSPGLTPSGKIYIADSLGGLTMVNPDGSLEEIIKGKTPNSPAMSGPLVASDNAVYYATADYFYAISPAGNLQWKVPLPTYSITSPIIRLTSDNRYLLFEDFIISTTTGDVILKASPEPLDRLIIGSNGKIYRLTQTYLEEINPDSKTATDTRQIKWDSRAMGTSFRFPKNAGITPEGNIWFEFGSTFEFSRLAWLDPTGVNINIFDYQYRGVLSTLIAIDKNNTVIMCGTSNMSAIGSGNDCRSNPIGTTTPAWILPIEGNPVGGALIENRIYIASGAGILYALEDPN